MAKDGGRGFEGNGAGVIACDVGGFRLERCDRSLSFLLPNDDWNHPQTAGRGKMNASMKKTSIHQKTTSHKNPKTD